LVTSSVATGVLVVESLTKHVGFVYAYAKKAKHRKIDNEKGGDRQKKQES